MKDSSITRQQKDLLYSKTAVVPFRRDRATAERIVFNWRLIGKSTQNVESMIGDAAQEVQDCLLIYKAEFEINGFNRNTLLLCKLGNNGLAKFSKIKINNIEVGQITGQKNDITFCINSNIFIPGRNEIEITKFTLPRRAWVDNGTFTEKHTNVESQPESVLRIKSFSNIGEICNIDEKSDSCVLQTTGGKFLTISFTSDHLLRLSLSETAVRHETLADKHFLCGKLPSQQYQIYSDSDSIAISNSRINIKFARSTSTFSIFDLHGNTIRENINILTCEGHSLFVWQLDAKEALFGLGENTTAGMNKRGSIEEIWLIHSFTKCDKPIPFLLSTAGYGLYLNSSFRSVFDLGAQDHSTGLVHCENENVDIFVFCQPVFKEMIKDYVSITGKSELPPKWAFGYWQSTTKKISQHEIESNLQGFNNQKIGLDVIAIDPNWQKIGLQSLEWDEGYFPDHEKFLRTLAANNLNLSLWTCPFLNQTSKLYHEAFSKGYLFRHVNGRSAKVDWWMGFDAGLIDFTNPAAVQWWSDKMSKLVSSGARVVKIDGGDTDETPPDLVSHDGMSMREIHNAYPILFAKTVYEAISNASDSRVLVWTRTGCAGIQRYPSCWGGDQAADFSGGRVLVKAAQQAGLAGISFWSKDMGGFSGAKPSIEYYVRSYQWGLFCPISRAHGPVTAPWEMGDRAKEIVYKYLDLRYRLLPTIYSYARTSVETGIPMVRSMFLEYQNDAETTNVEYQYMFGPDLLVAPVYEESDDIQYKATRQVYLPAGIWYDFWEDKLFSGAQYLSYEAELDKLPLFVRAGGIIAYGENKQRASINGGVLEIHFYTGGDGNFILYDDDGVSQKYKQGCFAKMPIELRQNTDTVAIKIGKVDGCFDNMPSEYKIKVVIHSDRIYNEVLISGDSLSDSTKCNANSLKYNFVKKHDSEIVMLLQNRQS